MNLQADLIRLEQQKELLLNELRLWSPAQLAQRPAAESWSALEVLDHLVLTEKEIAAAARAGLAAPRTTGVRDRLGFLMVERIFLTERRVKVPRQVTSILPGKNLELATICGRWDTGRNELAGLLQDCSGLGARDGIFRHPVTGMMTVQQVLRFFSVHIMHHRFQLTRIQKSLAQPT
ncbi:MAG: hypothetical protein NVSMB62_19850 [Acidobacteriaceae bacterium]